ncbi:MAG: response regulator transcription factor [Clostridiales bacterium]|nr:response regulator transcription factor [Clostridiales bacterium]
MYKILIVEDDKAIASILCDKPNKWGPESHKVNDFENVLLEFTKIKPQLVLVDINLPYYDGFYWCEKIRKISNIPIVFISSRAEDSDKIRAITGGGDDYIEKPFSADVLLAKVLATLRRAYSYSDSDYNIISHEKFFLDLEKAIVTYDDTEISLTRNECIILSLLIKAAGKIVSRTKFIKSLWEDDNFIDENTLTVNLNRLRKKLKQIKDADVIETVKGKGYKLL